MAGYCYYLGKHSNNHQCQELKFLNVCDLLEGNIQYEWRISFTLMLQRRKDDH